MVVGKCSSPQPVAESHLYLSSLVRLWALKAFPKETKLVMALGQQARSHNVFRIVLRNWSSPFIEQHPFGCLQLWGWSHELQ